MPVIEKRGVPYDAYAKQQGSKINAKRERFLANRSARTRNFVKQFKRARFNSRLSGRVLCLGARTGCEVKAMRELGFDSIGIDLHPALENDPLVLRMDWHNMSFGDESFDSAFTNAIDHCYDLGAFTREVGRVLIPGGAWIVFTSRKQRLSTKEDPELYMRKSSNFLFWDTPRALADKMCEEGSFEFVEQWKLGKWDAFTLRKLKSREKEAA